MTMAASGDRAVYVLFFNVLCRVFHFSICFFLFHTLVFRALQATKVWTARTPTHRNAHTKWLTKPIEMRNEQSGWIDDGDDHSMYRMYSETLCARRAMLTPTRPTGNGNYSEHKIYSLHMCTGVQVHYVEQMCIGCGPRAVDRNKQWSNNKYRPQKQCRQNRNETQDYVADESVSRVRLFPFI